MEAKRRWKADKEKVHTGRVRTVHKTSSDGSSQTDRRSSRSVLRCPPASHTHPPSWVLTALSPPSYHKDGGGMFRCTTRTQRKHLAHRHNRNNRPSGTQDSKAVWFTEPRHHYQTPLSNPLPEASNNANRLGEKKIKLEEPNRVNRNLTFHQLSAS